MASIEACQHCTAKILDPEQRTCPQCLEPLNTRSFRSEADLERYRRDRRTHGAPVPDEDEGTSSRLIAIALGAAATLMVLAGGTIAFAGVSTGEFPDATNALGQAVIPLAMGLGLFEMARRYGGAGA